MARLGCALVLVLLAFAAHAEVYRCQVDGHVLFTDHACAHGQGEAVDLDAANLSIGSQMITPDMASMAERYTQRMQALAAARAVQRQRRQVAGVVCPLNREITAAVQAHRVLLCMTPTEVTAAQRPQNDRLDVHERPLPDGVSAQEWVYATTAPDWPAVVQFRSGHVVGYGSALPVYEQRPRRYLRYYYWPHYGHGHEHGSQPVPFDAELYQPQLPTIIDPPGMNAYPSTDRGYMHRQRPHDAGHTHWHGHHRP